MSYIIYHRTENKATGKNPKVFDHKNHMKVYPVLFYTEDFFKEIIIVKGILGMDTDNIYDGDMKKIGM